MRIGAAMSTAALAVSAAALVLVIILFITEWQDPREPDAEHSQELTEVMLQTLIENHVNALIKANGITDENIETMFTIPGWGCFWTQMIHEGKARAAAKAGDTPAQSYSYNRFSDVWSVTSVDLFCENGIETWTVDDNSGEITYGRLVD